MMLSEANGRLKTVQLTEQQLWELSPLYLVLDLDKDEFCKMVDAVGLDTLLERASYYKKVYDAVEEQLARDRYLKAVRRLEQLEEERESLTSVVNAYEFKRLV